MRPAIVLLTFLCFISLAFGYPSNPPVGYAGQPPSGNNCINCHGGNPLNASGGTLTISGLPMGGYVPGTTYHLTVTQARTGMARWGFELTAIYQSGTSWLQAGDLIVTDATHTNLGVGSGTAPDYIRQTSAGSYPGTPGPTSWNFDWTAPAMAIGPIGFYASGLAANNNGGTSGDWCYTTSTTVNPNTTPPNLDVTLTPLNPPIYVPAQGGSFQFDASVANMGPSQIIFSVWARIKNPDGTYTAPTLGPIQVNPPVGPTITRTRTQNVPGTWAAGDYIYLGYANIGFAYPAIDSSSFLFTKQAEANGGPSVWDSYCYGELFPGERSQNALTPADMDLSISPNPFNPITAIRYQLQATSQVTLTVWDTAGRLVTTLVDGRQEAGEHSVTFDGSNLASGVYLYTLTAGSHSASGKMMLLK